MRGLAFLCFFLLGQSLMAGVGYPAALPNHNLGQEIKDSTYRRFPNSNLFSITVDGQPYARASGLQEFYHGIGYWLQLRTETRLQDYFVLNTRSIFFAGSNSYGYTQSTGDYHLIGFYGQWPDSFLGTRFEGRAGDLERQTIGQGLMIEEKELRGAWLKWSTKDFYLKVINDGTGGLVFGDDLYAAEMGSSFFGIGAIWWTAGEQSNLPRNRAPLYFINSNHDIFSGLEYFIEVGSRDGLGAGIIGLKKSDSISGFSYSTRLQARKYEDKFGEDFVGQIQNMYVTYDQYDKSYMNTSNILVTDDNLKAYSVNADFNYVFNSLWSFHSRNEVVQLDFEEAAHQTHYLYRVGATYFPVKNRPESITIFFSNKILNESHKRPPDGYAISNVPLFNEADFFGIEADFGL